MRNAATREHRILRVHVRTYTFMNTCVVGVSALSNQLTKNVSSLGSEPLACHNLNISSISFVNMQRLREGYYSVSVTIVYC